MRFLRPVPRTVSLLLFTAALAAGCTSTNSSDGTTVPESGTDTTSGQPETVLGQKGTYDATIRRGAGGVPHITADTLANVSFGQGWASGEDRTCDLADQVLKINGERAKWLGAGEDNANVESDVAWRAIGIRDVAGQDWKTAAKQTRELITAYADGWNSHLAEVGADGISDWCAGKEWVRPVKPVEVYAYARSIALQGSGGAVSSLLPTAQPPSAAKPASFTPPTPSKPSRAPEPTIASNGWAIGADRSTNGGGMLVANPHFPWEGELRFWEVHLTVPGKVDIYGVQLSGLPGIGIGFTKTFGWTHTVSAGNRFTAYKLDLVAGDPTSYHYGDTTRKITSTDITVEVLGKDGKLTQKKRTLWRSHYGPMLDFPGFGWSDTAAITYRDGNINNDEFVDQYLQMMQADNLDDFIDVHRKVTGVPLFNTVATSADGRAWYGDTATVPKLSRKAIAGYQKALIDDPIVKIAADNGAVLLNGSDPTYEWQDVPGARDPGLTPFNEMPVLERKDYVFNANDSFWMAHATELLDGAYSPLHGAQGTARSPRTRENATVLSDTSPTGPSGTDGTFTLDELAAAAVQNKGYTSRALRADVVKRCTGAKPVIVAALADDDGAEVLPAATVDIAKACQVLANWDGVYDLDRSGPVVWRELMSRYDSADFTKAGALWANPFDPANPVTTPNGLAPAAGGGTDLVLTNLARAVQVLDAADLPVDVALGKVQTANRNGKPVPIHGGAAVDGTTNVVGFGRGWSILDPTLTGLQRDTVAPGSNLARVTDVGGKPITGYRISNGTSFLLALAYGKDGPEAKAFLTYSNTADRKDPNYTAATEAFSKKEWRDIAFTEADVARTTVSTERVQG